jgi:hypothetical protein
MLFGSHFNWVHKGALQYYLRTEIHWNTVRSPYIYWIYNRSNRGMTCASHVARNESEPYIFESLRVPVTVTGTQFEQLLRKQERAPTKKNTGSLRTVRAMTYWESRKEQQQKRYHDVPNGYVTSSQSCISNCPGSHKGTASLVTRGPKVFLR